MPQLPIIIDVHKAALVARGYADFEDWASRPGHVYIGRRVHYVPETFESAWKNPYVIKKAPKGPKDVLTREEAVGKYYAYARMELLPKLLDLREATELGCWCTPQLCHGHAILRILAEEGQTPHTVPPPFADVVSDQLAELGHICEKNVTLPTLPPHIVPYRVLAAGLAIEVDTDSTPVEEAAEAMRFLRGISWTILRINASLLRHPAANLKAALTTALTTPGIHSIGDDMPLWSTLKALAV
jgi:hypothetical protein